MSKKMFSRQCLSQEPHQKRLIKILIIQPTNTINSDADQKTQMPRNLVIMIIWLEFKEMFPTLWVIHADDLTGKVRGITLQMIKFQKNICLCGAYTGDVNWTTYLGVYLQRNSIYVDKLKWFCSVYKYCGYQVSSFMHSNRIQIICKSLYATWIRGRTEAQKRHIFEFKCDKSKWQSAGPFK